MVRPRGRDCPAFRPAVAHIVADEHQSTSRDRARVAPVLREFRAIDAHVAGTPVRLLISGVPTPAGASMEKRRTWLEHKADRLRRDTILEPRGRRDLVGAIFAEPVSPDADAGLLFLDEAGYPRLSVPSVVAAVTVALERGLLVKASPFCSDIAFELVRLTLDTPKGTIVAIADVIRSESGLRARSVRVTTVPSFVVAGGVPVSLTSRKMRADIAYDGTFRAIVDSEGAGIALTSDRLDDLRRLAIEICSALQGHDALVDPETARAGEVNGVIFTGPPQTSDAHLRSVTISSAGSCDRSGLSGCAAVMAVLRDMSLLEEGGEVVVEGLQPVASRGRLARLTNVGERPAVLAEIVGTAWITSEHTLSVHDEDPLSDGFIV